MTRLITAWLFVLLLSSAAWAVNADVYWDVVNTPTFDGVPDPVDAYPVYACLGTCTLDSPNWELRTLLLAVDNCPGDIEDPRNPEHTVDCHGVFAMSAGPPGVLTTWSFYMTTLLVSGLESVPSDVIHATGREADIPLVPPQNFHIDFTARDDGTATASVTIRKNGNFRVNDGAIPLDERLCLIVTEDRRRDRFKQ